MLLISDDFGGAAYYLLCLSRFKTEFVACDTAHSVTTIFGAKGLGNEGKPWRQKVPKFLHSLAKTFGGEGKGIMITSLWLHDFLK